MARRDGRVRRRLLIGAAAVLAAAVAGGVAVAHAGTSPGYRTAAVSRGAATATLTLAGTITPVTAQSVGFAQPGTVASVDVAPGAQVTVGQTLAALDLTALQAKLSQARATEAAAQQTLDDAENGQLAAGSGGSGGSTGPTGSVTADQQGVTDAQKAVDTTLATANADLQAASSSCSAPASGTQQSSGRSSRSTTAGDDGAIPASPSPASPSGHSSGAPASGSPAGGSTPEGSCLPAESVLLQAETTLATQESDLASAEEKLSTALDHAGPASGFGATGAEQSGSSGASSAASAAVPSAAQLAADQAAVDADAAAVTVAEQNLGQGTILSPLTGTVLSVALSPGQVVSAASSSALIVVDAPDGEEIDATVPVTGIAQVGVGQHASVLPDGGSTPLPATVTAVSAVPSASGYRIVLGLDGTASSSRLVAGGAATVTLTTGSATGGLVVPTSAIHTLGTRHLVQVLGNGSVTTTPVTIGTSGPVYTQVLSGLKLGQRVVLADLSSTVTTDNSTLGGLRTLGGRGGGAAGGRGSSRGGRVGG